jgi:hypothetical protein
MFDLLADLVLQGARGQEPDVDDPATPLERLGDPRVPGRKAIESTVVVLVPATTATGCGERPATLAGWGGISTEEARRMVAHAHAWTRALIDPIDDAILGFDSHERVIPRALRRLLLTRDQHCLGPCNHTAVGTDLDHTVRFTDGGPTTERNLGSMCRPMHRIKDEGYVDVHRRNDGAFVWRTRWGGTLVTRPAMPVRRPDDPPPF